jgi:hypothetical protein
LEIVKWFENEYIKFTQLMLPIYEKLFNLIFLSGHNVNQEFGWKIEWFENIKIILNNYGISNVWVNQHIDKKWLNARVKLHVTLTDQFKQNWQATVKTSPKALNYRIYENDFF